MNSQAAHALRLARAWRRSPGGRANHSASLQHLLLVCICVDDVISYQAKQPLRALQARALPLWLRGRLLIFSFVSRGQLTRPEDGKTEDVQQRHALEAPRLNVSCAGPAEHAGGRVLQCPTRAHGRAGGDQVAAFQSLVRCRSSQNCGRGALPKAPCWCQSLLFLWHRHACANAALLISLGGRVQGAHLRFALACAPICGRQLGPTSLFLRHMSFPGPSSPLLNFIVHAGRASDSWLDLLLYVTCHPHGCISAAKRWQRHAHTRP